MRIFAEKYRASYAPVCKAKPTFAVGYRDFCFLYHQESLKCHEYSAEKLKTFPIREL